MATSTQTEIITTNCGGEEVTFTMTVVCNADGTVVGTIASEGLENDEAKHVGGRPVGR